MLKIGKKYYFGWRSEEKQAAAELCQAQQKLELSMAIWLVAGLAIDLITWTKTVEIQARFAEL